jgi:hypothetical protein
VLNDALVGPGDFHACAYYDHLANQDLSRVFVDEVDAMMRPLTPRPIVHDPERRAARAAACEAMVADLMARVHLKDRNRIKPGVAEATRALLRRIPDRLLIHDRLDADVRHLVLLAEERGVKLERLDGGSGYRAVAVIRTLGQD